MRKPPLALHHLRCSTAVNRLAGPATLNRSSLLVRVAEPAQSDAHALVTNQPTHPYTSAIRLRRSAPEVLGGADPSVESDTYAIGLVLFLLFSGERPFAKQLTAMARVRTHTRMMPRQSRGMR